MKPTNHMSQPHAIQQHLRPARCSHMRSEAIYDNILCGQSHHSLKAYTSTNMYHIPHKYAFVLALNTQFMFYRVQCIVHTRRWSAAIAAVHFLLVDSSIRFWDTASDMNDLCYANTAKPNLSLSTSHCHQALGVGAINLLSLLNNNKKSA